MSLTVGGKIYSFNELHGSTNDVLPVYVNDVLYKTFPKTLLPLTNKSQARLVYGSLVDDSAYICEYPTGNDASALRVYTANTPTLWTYTQDLMTEAYNVKIVEGADMSRINDPLYVPLSGYNGERVSYSDIFQINYDYDNLSGALDFTNWRTSGVVGAQRFVSNFSQVTSVNCSGWDTSSMEYLTSAFAYCDNLTSIDLTGWDFRNVVDMSTMFSTSPKLTLPDMSNWNMSKVQLLDSMFRSCTQIKELDLSNWNVSSATMIMGMFYGCSNMTSLDISGWNLPTTARVNTMFTGCTKLSEITCTAATQTLFKNNSSTIGINFNTWSGQWYIV